MTNNNIKQMQHIAIFASGRGSNAERLMQHFVASTTIKVAVVIVNKPDAAVINIAQKYGILVELVDKSFWLAPNNILRTMQSHKIDFIVLAGFLWRVPAELVAAFPQKIVNLHPSLLPKFGGKGMYGMRVHEAVVAAAETETGITIHYVNEAYDEGAIIAQFKCVVTDFDTAETVADKIHELEKAHFVTTVIKSLTNSITN
jgi:phosphoribosylglycinamide formyltransferase 1